MAGEDLEKLIEVAFHDVGKIMRRIADAMIGQPIIGEIVGANLLVAIAVADLVLAMRRVFRVFLGDFLFKNSRAKKTRSALSSRNIWLAIEGTSIKPTAPVRMPVLSRIC